MNKKRKAEIIKIMMESEELVEIMASAVPPEFSTYKLVNACLFIVAAAIESIDKKDRLEVMTQQQCLMYDMAEVYAEMQEETKANNVELN